MNDTVTLLTRRADLAPAPNSSGIVSAARQDV